MLIIAPTFVSRGHGPARPFPDHPPPRNSLLLKRPLWFLYTDPGK